MPMKWSEPEKFVDFLGVKIFHTYKDELSDIPQSYWYATSDTAATDSDYEFDVRDLPAYEPRNDKGDFEEHRKAIRVAITSGILISDVPPQMPE